ncbi:MAG: hypothetical protein ACFFD6_09120 [Candidatus Thorarchaeota archaeon]
MQKAQTEIRKTVVLEEVVVPQAPRILRVKSERLHPATYIIESSSSLQILLKPWMVGADMAIHARESSTDFIRAVYQLVPEFRKASISSVAEVVPLAGALYYSLAEAFYNVFGETYNRCFIGARRQLTPKGWKTELSYKNFEALPPNPIVLIGDTIATGGTVEAIIKTTTDHAPDIQAILVYSIAGGLQGAIRLTELAKQLGIPFYCFYSNAIFGVEENGTDMPWLHPGTIATVETLEMAEEAYGPDLGRRWCSIWDWGDRAKHPLKHLGELLKRCDDELSSPIDDMTRVKLTSFRRETSDALDHWHLPLSSSEGLPRMD